jgi:signal transduction histidine kinase
VIANLIGNAFDAMRTRGGRLILRSRCAAAWPADGKDVRITIADTGGGMDRDTLRQAFEPFFTTKGIGGTGLGLWIAEELISKNGGRIRVRSSSRPGRSGSVFVLSFPHAGTHAL